jgi:CxxC-x17-CxxC domain-containing protein
MDSASETIICRNCGVAFSFTEGEQAFFMERGYRPPVLCRDCRDLRRANARPAADRKAYPVQCAECGRETTVPFEPRPGKPVYCDECFAVRRGARQVRP